MKDLLKSCKLIEKIGVLHFNEGKNPEEIASIHNKTLRRIKYLLWTYRKLHGIAQKKEIKEPLILKVYKRSQKMFPLQLTKDVGWLFFEEHKTQAQIAELYGIQDVSKILEKYRKLAETKPEILYPGTVLKNADKT